MSWYLPPVTVNRVYLASEVGEQLPWWITDFGYEKAWEKSTGQGVKVGIVDTGIDEAHYLTGDLRGAIAGVKDFSGSLRGVLDSRQGHGTHVAAIIGARRRNDKGIAGISHHVQMVIARALGDNGSGSDDSVANAIVHCADAGCMLVNLSLGSDGPSDKIRDAIAYAAGKGCICVAAAGNSAGSVNYPAKYGTVIAVSAVDRQKKLAPFSCFGPEIDAAAPGVDILSCYKNGTYAALSGSSMSAPMVTGAIALRLSWELSHGGRRTMNAADVLEWLAGAADDAGDPGADPKFGLGIINPDKINVNGGEPVEEGNGLWVWVPGGKVMSKPSISE